MRKAPNQARSRATVEAIVHAGARVLADRGWAGFTTNRVAEVAGVSIGSLYQYFPDKLALIDAVRRRHLEECLAIMRAARHDGKPLGRFLDDLVGNMMAAHDSHPGLHRVLLDEAPANGPHDPHSAYEREYLGHYAAAVAAYRRHRTETGDETVAMIMSDAVDGVIHNAARRGTLKSPEVKRELVRMLTLYLAGPSADEDPG